MRMYRKKMGAEIGVADALRAHLFFLLLFSSSSSGGIRSRRRRRRRSLGEIGGVGNPKKKTKRKAASEEEGKEKKKKTWRRREGEMVKLIGDGRKKLKGRRGADIGDKKEEDEGRKERNNINCPLSLFFLLASARTQTR